MIYHYIAYCGYCHFVANDPPFSATATLCYAVWLDLTRSLWPIMVGQTMCERSCEMQGNVGNRGIQSISFVGNREKDPIHINPYQSISIHINPYQSMTLFSHPIHSHSIPFPGPRQEFTSQVQNFMLTVTAMTHQGKGSTVLYIPQDMGEHALLEVSTDAERR